MSEEDQLKQAGCEANASGIASTNLRAKARMLGYESATVDEDTMVVVSKKADFSQVIRLNGQIPSYKNYILTVALDSECTLSSIKIISAR